jgi:CubicO group peptidase (beta-lactamase class C family)
MTADRPDLREAAAFALANETGWPRDIRAVIEGETFDPPPWNIVKGPLRDRGAPAGEIIVGGRSRAAWGDTGRGDMVFSVTKSYIGLLAAIALDEGLIDDADAPVARSVDHPAFAAPNDTLTWRQLLQQTSEWRGTLWNMPDTVDRNRQLSPTEDQSRFNTHTPHGAPGSYWDYNDIRVNALCLALTLRFDRSLRDVLEDRLFRLCPSDDWDWTGYPESTVRIGGADVPVVVGGGHWGGGLVASVAHDLLLGRLVLGRGLLDGRRIVSEQSLDLLLAPCPLEPNYGGLWWLNTGRRLYPDASEASVFALGVGLNAIWIEPRHDLVAVLHGIEERAMHGFVARVMAAL